MFQIRRVVYLERLFITQSTTNSNPPLNNSRGTITMFTVKYFIDKQNEKTINPIKHSVNLEV